MVTDPFEPAEGTLADVAEDTGEVAAAMASGQAAEFMRQGSHSPEGMATPAGVVLAGASAEDLVSLGMSPGADIPAVPYGEQPADYRS